LSELPRPARIAVAVDATNDLAAACIIVSGILPDGRILVERAVDPKGRQDHRAGIAWVVPRLKELKLRQRVAAVIIDPASPAGSLLVEAERAGLPLQLPASREIGQAFGQFLAWVAEKRLLHPGEENPDLRRAVAIAVCRDIGDGQRAWSRRHSPGDITPLCAATLAAWGAHKFARPLDLAKTVVGPT
jgi:hypothetical protein